MSVTRRISLFLLAVGIVTGRLAIAGPEDHPDLDYPTVVVRAFFDDRAMIQTLADYKAPWTVDLHKGFALLDVTASEYDWLVDQGFRVVVDPQRSAALNRPAPRAPAQRAGIPGFACYRTVTETLASGAALAAAYPGLATWSDIGDSWEKTAALGGTDIFVLKLTNASISGDKPTLFLLGGIHAREYASAELVTRFAEHLLANYEVDADINWLLDHHEIHIVLQTNPDGRKQAQTGLLWRKNTNQNYCSPTSTNRGADLNRNFPYQWGGAGGSNSQCSATYRGTEPTSEPEALAVQNYARSIFPDQRGDLLTDAAPDDATGVMIDVHSFGEVMLWSWGFTPTPPPNGPALGTFARKVSSFNAYSAAQALSYSTDGTTKDFGYGDLGLAAYTLELGTEFFEDCGYFEANILDRNIRALTYAAKAARTPFLTPYGPDVRDLAVANPVLTAGELLQLSLIADDTAYDASISTQPTQDIAAAQAWIDIPPWLGGATPVALSAADGAFDSGIESVNATLDTSGLADGRHMLFTRARDADGNDGAVSAAFFHVLDATTAPRLTGTVRALGNGDALAATVAAGPQFVTQTEPQTGVWELLVPPGDYTLTITPDSPDYAGATLGNIAAVTATVTTANALLAPFCSVFDDDVEQGSGDWTADAGWVITTEAANSPTHSWTESAGGNYANNRDQSLTSASISLAGFDAAELRFAHICDTEATYDFCRVETSIDGATWQEAARYDGAAGSFETVTLPLAALSNATNARFRFRFTSDVSISADGWHLDDIEMRAAGVACAGPDADTDGISDAFDNCSAVENPTQRDTDGDGFGNVCDADIAPGTNDCNIDFLDLGALKAAFFTSPGMATWNADADFNGDDSIDFLDLGALKSAFFGAPGPSGISACVR